MRNKAGDGDLPGFQFRINFSRLPVWAMAGLGFAMALYKAREEHNNDNGIDRLPDDILGEILSRLTIIEASRTRVLSKRWRRIGTMNNSLYFSCLGTLDVSADHHDNVCYGDRERFLEAVDQCLQLYSYGHKLKIFSVHCCFLNGHTHCLVRWMNALSRLDVQHIYLGHSCPTGDVDPLFRGFFFSFNLIDGLSKLQSLNLMSCFVKTSFVGQCNSLIRLDLTRVPLFTHELSDILMFCPNLQSLSMIHCVLPLNVRISGPNLKLENLILLVCYNVQKLEISDFNVITLMIDIRNEVEISLSSVPKLERLHLRTPWINYCFGDFRRDLPQLKYLLIQKTYQEMLWLPPEFEVFRNVRVLFLLTRGLEASAEVDLWNFAPVLSACPLLEEFYLMVGGPVCKEEGMARWPVLQHQHLTHMELSGFSNTQNELEFAKFFLTSAKVLQSLVLRLSCRRYNEDRFYFEDEKDLKEIDAEYVCASLQVHALSMLATVELF